MSPSFKRESIRHQGRIYFGKGTTGILETKVQIEFHRAPELA